MNTLSLLLKMLIQSVTVKIYDDDSIQVSELIGCAQVSLKDLEPGKVKDVWLKLVKDLEIQRDRKDRGQVSLIFLETELLCLGQSAMRSRCHYALQWTLFLLVTAYIFSN
jgi:hypothetical protein